MKLKRYFDKNYPHLTLRLVDKTILEKVHSLSYYAVGMKLKEVSDFLWKQGR